MFSGYDAIVSNQCLQNQVLEANMNQRNAADSAAGGGQHETTPLIISDHSLMPSVNGGVVVGDNGDGRDNGS